MLICLGFHNILESTNLKLYVLIICLETFLGCYGFFPLFFSFLSLLSRFQFSQCLNSHDFYVRMCLVLTYILYCGYCLHSNTDPRSTARNKQQGQGHRGSLALFFLPLVVREASSCQGHPSSTDAPQRQQSKPPGPSSFAAGQRRQRWQLPRHTVRKLEVKPGQWATGEREGAKPLYTTAVAAALSFNVHACVWKESFSSVPSVDCWGS